MDGLDLQALFSQTRELTGDYQSAALGSILRIQSEALALQTLNSCDSQALEAVSGSHCRELDLEEPQLPETENQKE